MRTSNKILLGVFLTAVLIFASIHIALYAKYKSGDFVTMKTIHDDEFIRPHLKTVHYIVANGLENFKIIPSDTLRLEIEKAQTNPVKFTILGDSLILHGDSTIVGDDKTTEIFRSSQEVNLYLPSSEKITLDYCTVELQTVDDSSKARSYRFALTNSTYFHLAYNGFNDATDKYINSIFIQADSSSSIEFAEHTKITQANLKLNNSLFEDNTSLIEKLSIDADKKSTVKLTGANLQILNARK